MTDPEVSVPGFPGTWTRAKAAQTDPNDTSTPDAEDVAAAQKGAGGAPGAPPIQPTSRSAAPTPVIPANNQRIDPADLFAIIRNPYASAASQQLAASILQAQMKPRDPVAVGKGTSLIDPITHKEIYKNNNDSSDDSSTVKDYKYYQKTLPPGQTPMPFDVWSTAKARAGAATNTIMLPGENAGANEAYKLDAAAVRKGQDEQMPALEDADHNFALMQDSIARNGGKLPTGGELAKFGLDINRARQYLADNWGIHTGENPNEVMNLEAFNKGGMKAAGDMAKAIGGSRVLKVEFEQAQRANPGIGTSDFGNKYLLDVNRQGIAVKRDYLQAQEDYYRNNKHSLDGFQKAWKEEIKANPRPLSTYSTVTPIDNGDGSQFVKLPSTGQGGYTWYRQGQDGLVPMMDKGLTDRLDKAGANAGAGVPPQNQNRAPVNGAPTPTAPARAPVAGASQQGGQIPASSINALRSNPALRSQFDAKYGQGAADRVLSGQQ